MKAVVQLVELSPLSVKVTGLHPSLEPFRVEFACSPRARVGFLRGLQFPPTEQKQAH